MNNIIGVYKITNTITGDFYVGSSKNVKKRWASHKCTSTWNKCKNNTMYIDMRKYGLDKFDFQVIEEAEIGQLKEKEQQFIETLKPTYNSIRASGLDIERRKEYKKEYHKSDKYKESHRKASNKYENQICCYNNEVLTLATLSMRFIKAGISHPTLEAKKYLIGGCND